MASMYRLMSAGDLLAQVLEHRAHTLEHAHALSESVNANEDAITYTSTSTDESVRANGNNNSNNKYNNNSNDDIVYDVNASAMVPFATDYGRLARTASFGVLIAGPMLHNW